MTAAGGSWPRSLRSSRPRSGGQFTRSRSSTCRRRLLASMRAVVVLISLPALRLMTEDELRAVVAHETGHEYVAAQYQRATAEGRTGRLQDLELVCDIIAVVNLHAIGQKAWSLVAGIEKLLWFDRFHFGGIDNPDYPPRSFVDRSCWRSRKESRESRGTRDASPSSQPDRVERRSVHVGTSSRAALPLVGSGASLGNREAVWPIESKCAPVRSVRRSYAVIGAYYGRPASIRYSPAVRPEVAKR